MRISWAGSSIRGFSLLELLVVLAVSGSILTLVPPMLPNVIDSVRIRQATREIAAALRQARSLAITTQEESALLLDVDKKSYALGGKQKHLMVPDHATLTLIAAGIEQVSASSGGIRFFADGSSTGGRIVVSYAPYEYQVDVNWLTGRIHITP